MLAIRNSSAHDTKGGKTWGVTDDVMLAVLAVQNMYIYGKLRVVVTHITCSCTKKNGNSNICRTRTAVYTPASASLNLEIKAS